jgi:putative ABC transport system substrate-binding protein
LGRTVNRAEQRARRRIALSLCASLLGFSPPLSAQATRLRKVAFLGGSTRELAAHFDRAFLDAMRGLGWSVDRNLAMEYRWADGDVARLEGLARELVASRPEVILAPPTVVARAAQRATSEIPIVFCLAEDPVGAGLVKSLARPGGNLTGLSTVNAELGPKRLQLLKEVSPSVARVGVIFGPSDVQSLRDIESAAPALGMQIVPIRVSKADEFAAAFRRGEAERIEGLLVTPNPLSFTHRAEIAEAARRAKWPAVGAATEFAEAGALMAYAVSFPHQFRRAAIYVDKILRGANPADLPVQQPENFTFVVNARAATAIGLKLSPGLLARVDRVIE